MDNLIYWAILCLGAALVLFVMEIFVPSGGLLGFAAAGSLVAGIVLLFMKDMTTGLIGALVTVVALPFVIGFALKVWPNTPVMRWLTLHAGGKSEEQALEDAASAVQPATMSLIGKSGKALTDLRPVGTVLLEGKRTECLAESGVIPRGASVKVIAADGITVKVREIAT